MDARIFKTHACLIHTSSLKTLFKNALFTSIWYNLKFNELSFEKKPNVIVLYDSHHENTLKSLIFAFLPLL